MSKKKNKKSNRVPAKKPHLSAEMQEAMAERRKIFDNAFQVSCGRVREVLTRFHPGDALMAVNVSDLWQPNRASQVKHLLAFSLLVSTPKNSFSPARMNTYEEFSELCGALIEALPDVPMLEDYVPEEDWGEVKVLLGQEAVAILHGGPVQRVVDHIEAFRICHGNGTQAEADLESAIRLQDEFLKLIPRNGGDQTDEPTPGHVEVPPASFWEVVIPALKQLSDREFQGRYVVELGQPASWKDASGFGDAVMTGTVLPWLAVSIDGTHRAMSLRNTVTVVIDSWAKVAQDAPARVAARLGAYLAKRIKSLCLTGPLLLRSRGERVPLPIAAVLTDGPHNFLVVPVPPGQLPQIGKAVAAMRRVMRDRDWGLQIVGTSEGFRLCDAQGAIHGPTTVKVLLVSTHVSTGPSMIKPPSADAQLMSLVDACTIFDSVESVEELARFWIYVDGLKAFGGSALSDLGDLFGSFRDAHAQIIEGALVPNFLSLDPHWGASWRYEKLKKFWKQAPLFFPDEDSAWETHERKGVSSLTLLTARNAPKLAWSSVIGTTTLHFILDVDAVGLEPQDGSLLELFVHCAADSIAERESIIAPFLQLPLRRINLHCFSANDLLASVEDEQIQRAVAMPLITDWEEIPGAGVSSYQARLTVNLAKLVQDLEDAEDARFEVSCAVAVVEYLFTLLGRPMPSELRQALAGTAGRPPRFTLNHMQRVVDVPDFTRPQVPRTEDYKVARRDLAILLKAQGVTPGTYTLDAAKALINPARSAYRDAVHQRIRTLDRESLLRYCVEQYDALIASYDRDELRVTQSLRHEVDFDREETLAEAHGKFVRESRNYRYLLESALVLTSPQASPVRAETVLSIQAMVDWLFVLYGASDVLHHGIDVGGLRVGDQYVPEVFYSEERNSQEEVFGLEMAALRLGINVAEEDKVTTELSTQAYMELLDAAFAKDLRFTYSHMLQVLSTLIQWVSGGGAQELACGYICDRQVMAEQIVDIYPEMPLEIALKVIEFLLLTPDQAWRLIGRDVTEDDVPVWEHSKRGSRHTIRPLIELPGGLVLWGAAAVARTRRIWAGSISAGYLPADYPWPAVRAAVGQLKKELENGLENRAHEVCTRAMPYAIKGVDFKYRFPKHQFPDVGDFDVLAYRPEENQWLTVECKYNQPAFCLKDTRRLRDRIFGRGSDSGQLGKIEKRRNFLAQNKDVLRALLGWPEPADKPFSVTELYVSKDMHFWLRFPPYEVPTRFVQIDTLDAWLSSDRFPYGVADIESADLITSHT
ncbi:hypothetical protein Q6A51_16530 [Pseudomonas sp. KFB-139]|uniref:Uncharacterized protein n=1 Tax=Pseudomonas serbiensis TaxID=3064350 RepID=A0ABT9CSB5_9PSED|nr:hypothetical protein [Pseudomonas sp. KFB-138]MDO7928395.1 hypothetical protein [Pseudomonas sp. KFB-138]